MRVFLLAAFVAAALRARPLSLFKLRQVAPAGLAGPGELLGALMAGLSAGILRCDDGGRFALAEDIPTWRAALDERGASPRVRGIVERMAAKAMEHGAELRRETWAAIVDGLIQKVTAGEVAPAPRPGAARVAWTLDVTRCIRAARRARLAAEGAPALRVTGAGERSPESSVRRRPPVLRLVPSDAPTESAPEVCS